MLKKDKDIPSVILQGHGLKELVNILDADSLNTKELLVDTFRFVINYYVGTGVVLEKDDYLIRLFMHLLYHYGKEEGWLNE
jgi:hypothetical protein